MGLYQTKKFLHSKEIVSNNKKTTHRMENIFADTSDKNQYPKFIENLDKT